MDWLSERPIAHRGLHAEGVPENTLGAARGAVDAGYPIECDVRLTADGVAVVHHDATLQRLTGHDRRVDETPWSSLRSLSVLDTDETIPRLVDLLDVVDGQVPLLVELKASGRPGRLEQTVTEILDGYEGAFAVQSFSPLTVRWFRLHRPSWPRGQLLWTAEPREWTAHEDRFPVTWTSQPDFVAVKQSALPTTSISCRRGQLPVLAWTIRTESERERVGPHVDNVIFENISPERRSGQASSASRKRR
jgi:glycerophosphoryl diester phosphodiesterase